MYASQKKQMQRREVLLLRQLGDIFTEDLDRRRSTVL
jgi:hypothetical protein